MPSCTIATMIRVGIVQFKYIGIYANKLKSDLGLCGRFTSREGAAPPYDPLLLVLSPSAQLNLQKS